MIAENLMGVLLGADYGFKKEILLSSEAYCKIIVEKYAKLNDYWIEDKNDYTSDSNISIVGDVYYESHCIQKGVKLRCGKTYKKLLLLLAYFDNLWIDFSSLEELIILADLHG